MRKVLISLGAALLLAAVVAAPAGAWGSRFAYRSCGTNLIASSTADGVNKANTQKWSGSCDDTLGAALRYWYGGVTSYDWDPTYASRWTFDSPNNYDGGNHLGCPTCNVSTT